MKTATVYAVIAIIACIGIDAFGQQACNSGSGQGNATPFPTFPPVGNVPNFPPIEQLLSNPPSVPAVNPSPATATPQLRITPLDPSTVSAANKTAAAPSARVSLVTNLPAPKPAATEVAETKSPEVTDEPETLDPALEGLVGTWTAVSRYGDGELATVELQLDDRGWATFTVPGPDGKPSTIKRRVKLEDQELKLTGPEKALSLGKLIDVTARQMVLEQTSGQVTFVRI